MNRLTQAIVIAACVLFGAAPVWAQPGQIEAQNFLLSDGPCNITSGTGTPEAVVTGDPCDVFLRDDGASGTVIYVKETGAGNTGWLAVAGETLALSSTGPHVLGGTVNSQFQFSLMGTFAERSGFVINSTLQPPTGQPSRLLRVAGTIDEFSSGTHARFTAVDFLPPTITVGSATLTDSATVYISGAPSASVTGLNHALWVDAGLARFDNDIYLGAELSFTNVAPTIGSGFGTTPSVSAENGTAAFRIDVGTGGTATSGVIGLPTATTGWNCFISNFTDWASADAVREQTQMTASTTTTVSLENQVLSTGVATAWDASDILSVSCFAF